MVRSSWDKANDYSFNNSGLFIQNGNITITDSTGSLIYGNPMAAVPPTPDTGKPMLVVFAKDIAQRRIVAI